jgi:hypothetical protein
MNFFRQQICTFRHCFPHFHHIPPLLSPHPPLFFHFFRHPRGLLKGAMHITLIAQHTLSFRQTPPILSPPPPLYFRHTPLYFRHTPLYYRSTPLYFHHTPLYFHHTPLYFHHTPLFFRHTPLYIRHPTIIFATHGKIHVCTCLHVDFRPLSSDASGTAVLATCTMCERSENYREEREE